MSQEWFRLDGKVALITGAAQGIGRAVAEALAEAGARLVIVDHQADKLPQTAAALTGQGYHVVSVPADVTVPGQVDELVQQAIAAYGTIDILVNNAGGSGNVGIHHIEDVSDDLWDAVIDANLKSAFVCCRAVVPHRPSRYGRGSPN